MWALPVAAVPIVLHVLLRRRPVQVPFPAVRILLGLQRETTRRFRLRQVLLLAVRVALVAGAVLALAGPRWLRGRAASALNQSGLNAVFVLDTSCSMGTVRQDGSSRLDRGKTLAAQALELLSSDSRAALIACAEEPRRVVGALTYDRDAVADGIRQIQATCRPTDCAAALAEALRLLDDETAPAPRAVFLFTDLTANGWPDGYVAGSEHPVAVYAVDVGDDGALNRSVALPTGRRLGAIAGVPFQVVARGRIPAALRPATAELRVQGQLRGEVRLADEVRSEAAFRFAPLQEGTITGCVTLRGRDALAADDRACFVFRCLPPPTVLVIDGGGADAGTSAGQVLADALDRRGPSDPPQFQVTVTVPDGVRAEAVREADVVVLVDVPSLSVEQWRALREHVCGGGRLLVVGGPHVQAKGYEAASEGEGALFPWQIAPARPGERRTRLAVPETAHALGGLFDVSEAVLEESVFAPRLEVAPVAEEDVVLRYQTGAPALMERAGGQGRVLVFTGGIGAGGARRAFLRALVRYAATDAEPLWHPVGEAVRVESAGGVLRAARFRGPGDDRWRSLPLPDEERATAVLLPPQDEAGLYNLELTTDDGVEIRPLALNVDPAESEPRRLSAAELAARLPGLNCRVVSGAGELRALLGGSGEVVELNRYLVPMVLALLVIELLLAGRLYGAAPDEVVRAPGR